MKILMIVSVPFFHTQGTSFSSLDRALTLRNLGHSVDIVTYPKGKPLNIEGINIFRSKDISFLTGRKWKRGPTWYKAILTILLIPTVIKRLKTGQYDCLHAHEDSAYFAAFIKKISAIPFVYDMHSSLPEQLQAFSIKKKIIIKILNQLERFTIKTADTVMVICPHLYEKAKSIAPHKPVFLAENLPIMTLREENILTTNKTADHIRQELNLDHQHVILYTGSLGKNQGIDLLIDSAAKVVKQMKNVVYLLVGGEPSEIKHYKDVIQTKGLEQWIKFTGCRNPAQMNAFMELSSCLVSPRITGKNTPLKIYSYLDSGKPLVATNIYSHTQVLDHNTAILTDPTPDAYADGIMRVLNNEKLASTIGQAGKNMLARKYPRKEYIRQHKLMYEVIESARKPALMEGA